jgi:aryl-alcohol dehydrogenase-like predicted oxidoreductase
VDYTKLGRTGLEVSELCLGTWRFNATAADGTIETDRDRAHELLDTFADLGGNFIDTANGYGNGQAEVWIGEWLDERDREDYVVASKVYNAEESRFDNTLGRKNVRAEVEGTLSRLDTSYLDVYYIHFWDDETPIRETLRTMNQLVEAGKIHHIAASNLAAWQLVKSLWASDADGLERFASVQPYFNAAKRPSRLLDAASDQGLAVCPYCPLQQGFLTGKYDRDSIPENSRGDINDWELDYTDAQWRVLDAVERVAADRGATPAQVALRWLMDQRAFTCVPIFGARTVDQLRENVGAVDVSLSDEQYETIRDAFTD